MTSYAEFLAHAHTSFLRSVAGLVSATISPMFGSCSVTTLPSSALLESKGVTPRGQPLHLTLRLAHNSESRVTTNLSGSHGLQSFSRTDEHLVELLSPELLAALVVSVHHAHDVDPLLANLVPAILKRVAA